MKFTKIVIACMGALTLFGCNMGSVAGNDTQTASISNNGIANISITANGCKGIAANGGTCTVNVTYSAPAGSHAIGSTLAFGGLNGYNNNVSQQCTAQFSTNSLQCTITITSIGSTSSQQTALIYPNTYNNTSVSFTVGGGV